MKICIFGAASNYIDGAYIEKVESLGEKMAKRGHSLVFGAGENGLMGAAARGVHKVCGNVVGVIPKFFREESIERVYEKCDEIILTDTMAQRKSKMEDLADAFIITPGGIGTLEEFFEVLTLKQLGRHTKPIAILNINGYYDNLEAFLDKAADEKFINGGCKHLYFISSSEDETLDYIENDKRIKQKVSNVKLG